MKNYPVLSNQCERTNDIAVVANYLELLLVEHCETIASVELTSYKLDEEPENEERDKKPMLYYPIL